MRTANISVSVTCDASRFLDPVQAAANDARAIGAGIAAIGGILRCQRCGTESPLGDVGSHLATGWPKHHGLTMRWVTQRELDAEASTR